MLALAAGAAAAGAQDPVDLRTDIRRNLEPVEQGIEDVGPLSVSLRLLNGGLLQPTGFSEVYSVPGHPGWLMRIDGGLYAIFRQSVYSEYGAQVPSNTMFSIGPPAWIPGDMALLAGDAAFADDPSRPDTRIDSRIDTIEELLPPPRDPALGETGGDLALPQIIANQDYREKRLLGLMQDAADGAE